jgi:DNA-binding transcriptional ArsR family regulator
MATDSNTTDLLVSLDGQFEECGEVISGTTMPNSKTYMPSEQFLKLKTEMKELPGTRDRKRRVNTINSLGVSTKKKLELLEASSGLIESNPPEKLGKRRIDPEQLKSYKWRRVRVYLQLVRFYRPDEDSRPFIAQSVLKELGIPQPAASRYLKRLTEDGLICPENQEDRRFGECIRYIINVPPGGYTVDALDLDGLIARKDCSHEEFVEILKTSAAKRRFEIKDDIVIDWTVVQQIPGSRAYRKVVRLPCPYCDDRYRPVHRSHGYLSEGKKGNLAYHCKKCDRGTSLSGLLKDHFPDLHKDWLRLHREQGKGNVRLLLVPIKPTPPSEAEIQEWTDKIMRNLHEHGTCVQDLPEDHPARLYLESRKMRRLNDVWFVSEFGTLVKSMGKRCMPGARGPRVVWVGRDKNRRVSGYLGRSLDPGIEKRWASCKVREEAEGCIYIPDDLDLTKIVCVCEGIPDAIGLGNAVTAQGISFVPVAEYLLSLGVRKDQIRLVWDNEMETNPGIKRNALAARVAGWRVVEWKEGVPYKDINDAVVADAGIEDCLQLT